MEYQNGSIELEFESPSKPNKNISQFTKETTSDSSFLSAQNCQENDIDISEIPIEHIFSIFFNRFYSILCEQNQNYGYHINSIFDEYLEDSFEEFFVKISRILNFDNQLIFLTLNLIEKFIMKNQNEIIIDEINQFRIVITAMLLIKKNYDDIDSDYKLTYNILERYTPFTSRILRELEFQFFELMDYNLFLNDEEFKEYKNKVILNYINSINIYQYDS